MEVTSDLRFRAAISESETPSFCGISGNLAPSTRESLATTIVRFWCAKPDIVDQDVMNGQQDGSHTVLLLGKGHKQPERKEPALSKKHASN